MAAGASSILVGKHRRVRSVPMPTWVKVGIDAWASAAGIADGPVFRFVNRGGKIRETAWSEKVVWQLIRPYAEAASVPGIAPHDCRSYAESDTMPHENAFTALGWSSATSDAAIVLVFRYSSQSIIAGLGEGALACHNKPSDSFARGRLPVV